MVRRSALRRQPRRAPMRRATGDRRPVRAAQRPGVPRAAIVEDQVRGAGRAADSPTTRFAITGDPDASRSRARASWSRTWQRFVPLSIALVVVVLVLGVPDRARRAAAARRGDHRRRSGPLGVMVLLRQQDQHGDADPAAAADGDRHRLRDPRRQPLLPGAASPAARAPRSSPRPMHHVRVPSAVAWLTTAIGCATLIITPIPAIRDFGIYSTLGMTAIVPRLDDLRAGDAPVLLPDVRLTARQDGARPAARRVARRARPLRRAAPARSS